MHYRPSVLPMRTHVPPTGSSWIAVVRWRPRPPCLPHGDRPPGGGADRGSRRRGEREPGRDAGMPPGSRTGLREGRAAGRVPAVPGRSGAGRRTPARDHRDGGKRVTSPI